MSDTVGTGISRSSGGHAGPSSSHEGLAAAKSHKGAVVSASGEGPVQMRSALANRGGWKSLIVFVVLALAWIAGFSSRLFAVIRFESIIHEFDPWFNYRATHYMVEHDFYKFLNWFDERAWYPLGRIVGGTVYPGLMLTSGGIHWVLHSLHIPIHIRDICVFLAPTFSGLTALATYFLTKEIWNTGAGLFAACFIAIVPGYISRSVAGSYDNEGIAIFALMFTYYLWVRSVHHSICYLNSFNPNYALEHRTHSIRAVKTGSVYWGCCTALAYFYMVSAWGGYVFIINLIPLHVFVLLLMGRYSHRIFVAYTSFYILGLLCSMQIPFVGMQPIRTSEHMASAGVFCLLFAYSALMYLQSKLSKTEFRHLFIAAIVVSAGLVFLAVVGLTYLGYIAPWSGRFYSLWDTGYAKIHIPIIASVSEHQPTTWVSFFFDLHILVCVFPAGAWFVIKEINDERVFIILYAISAVYFAGVMVRLMLTLTPVVCVLAAIAFSKVFSLYLKDDTKGPGSSLEDDEEEREKSDKYYDKVAIVSKPLNGRTGARAKAGKKGKIGQSPAGAGNQQPIGGEQASVSDRGALGKEVGKTKRTREEKPKEEGVGMNIKSIVVVALLMMIMLFAVHCTWVTSNAYSSPSIVLASYGNDGTRNILDDFREAYYWLRQNTDDKARVMSWWDYGYQIAGMGNRTTLVDNNTWNNSHIALVGKAMSSNETAAYKIMQMLDVDYVLVIFGGVIGYSGDDINKFLWMVRIAEGEHPKDIRESDYFTPQGEFRVDAGGSQTLLNCLMYKLSYYRFGEMQLDFRTPSGYDRTRNVEIGNKNFKLEHLEEAYTTEHWLVRIYRVKAPSNRVAAPTVDTVKRRFSSKKTSRRKKGTLKNPVKVVKGSKPVATKPKKT